MATEKELLLSHLSKTLNQDTEQLTSLLYNEEGTELKENALDLVLAEDQKRIQKLKTTDGPSYDDGHKRGKKEVGQQYDKAIKTIFGVDSELKGNELIEFVQAEVSKRADSPLEPDKIRVSETYLNAVKAEKEKGEKAVQDLQKDFDDYKVGIERDKTTRSVRAKAATILEQLNPVLSENSQVAANQKSLFLDVVTSGEFKVEGEHIVALNPDGSPRQNDHGHDLHFDDFVKNTAKDHFDFSKHKPRSSGNPGGSKSGNEDPVDRTGWNWDGKPIQSEDEFSELVGKAKTKEEKSALLDAYNEFQSKG